MRLTASLTARTITGLAVPYGAPGSTSAGMLTITAGALALPADLSRIKLVDNHQHPPVPIGYALTAADGPDGLTMTWQLGTTPAAAAALQEAVEGLRDGLSVELSGVETDAAGTVTAATLTAVALVAVPAYDDARIQSIAASHTHTTQETPSMRLTAEQLARLAALRAQETRSPEEENELAQLAALEELANGPQPDDAAPPADAPVAAPAAQAAAAPAMLAAHAGALTAQRPLQDLYAAVHRVVTGVSRPEAEAALANITNSAIYGTVGESSYAGQLWQGVTYQRRFVQLMTQAALTSWKVTGWRFTTKPTVGDYAGDKAEIPTSTAAVEPVSVTAARLAGGWDFDRKFTDFGDEEFINAFFEAAREDYARKSDAKALAFILASASAPAGNALVGPSYTMLDAALLSADLLAAQTGGATPDYFLASSADRRALLRTNNANAPAFMDLLGVSPDKFIAAPSVPAGTVIAGVRGAATWYELGGSPIRVSAQHLTHGGIDEALFGYYATLLHDAKGIVKATFAAA